MARVTRKSAWTLTFDGTELEYLYLALRAASTNDGFMSNYGGRAAKWVIKLVEMIKIELEREFPGEPFEEEDDES